MLNISIFGGGGLVEIIFWKLEYIFVVLFSEITLLGYKELDKNRYFSILFFNRHFYSF